jgi:hypothetical protein
MRFAPVLALAVACGGHHATSVDATTPDSPPPDAPFESTLFDTGLCVDRACTQITAGIQTYTPRWALYADGATKQRWILLPAGTQIDTSDMDHWQFPVGTKIWKEFDALDGSGNNVRVETRIVQRIGSGDTVNDWFYAGYQWNATEDDTTEVPNGATNADGTMHDIPSHVECTTCHENLAPTRVLGFGALQLDEAPQNPGDLTLAALAAMDVLTDPPVAPVGSGSGSGSDMGSGSDAGSDYQAYFPMQATGGTADALGYLHANCGHCHNPLSQYYQSQTKMSFRLEVATVGDTAMTPTYLSAVGHTTAMVVNTHNIIVDPGHPELSVMIDRFEATMSEAGYTTLHMPELGTKTIDPVGDATLTSWIASIPPLP